jgi:phosphoribosyl 1,2-cyclic phosphodiesterase
MSRPVFQVVFLGTGVSTAIPSIRHVLDMKENPCRVCDDAMNNQSSKNKRNNVSVAIMFNDENNKRKCYLVDAGKTLRDTCLSTFVKYSIQEVNGILLTHGHADAMMGIDDLRDLQHSRVVPVPDPMNSSKSIVGFQILSGPMNIYSTQTTYETVSNAFPYLTTCQPCYLDKKNNVLERRIAYLKFNIINDFDHLYVHKESEEDTNIEKKMLIKTFPVYHGGDYVSLGFSFGKEGQFIYISDVKIIPEGSWKYLKSIPKIKYLIIDVLNWKGIFSHMGLDEVIEVAKELQPEYVYCIGMSCGMGMHDEIEAKIQREYGANFFLAYDGLCIDELEMY